MTCEFDGVLYREGPYDQMALVVWPVEIASGKQMLGFMNNRISDFLD